LASTVCSGWTNGFLPLSRIPEHLKTHVNLVQSTARVEDRVPAILEARGI
jgi:hypothetical protein